MSVNKRTLLLHRTKDSEGTSRELEVFEEDNTRNYEFARFATLYADTYTRFTFEYEYKNSTFERADVYITNRFTMDTAKSPDDITFRNESYYYYPLNDKNTSYITTQVDTVRKRSIIEVVLSMADFMYGDIYVQFYDKTTEKDRYCAPIITQFTNAPTCHAVGVYKWRPNFTTRNVEDYDNIFTSSFGSRRDYISEAGRSDVLSGNVSNSEYYNDFMESNRLITNGWADPVKQGVNEVSLSGHPVYMVEYRTFVPSAFSQQFGINNSPTIVSFSALNDGKGYLTSSVDNWQVEHADKYDLRMYTKDDDESFLNTAYTLTAAETFLGEKITIGGIRRVFVAHLTAASADRPEDSWFRDHTRACADFVLTGIDPYWMSDDKV
jgi:hypothetical protein